MDIDDWLLIKVAEIDITFQSKNANKADMSSMLIMFRMIEITSV
jgi:hypothetical protein